MYCGSCLRDNALASALSKRRHDVTLLPFYTPTLTDEENVSRPERVFFGGISVFLEQHLSLFRHTPAALDRLWDAPWVIKAFSSGSIAVDPKVLGALTVSTLQGEDGRQHKEIEKLLHWLQHEPRPDLVNIPFALLISLARPLKRALSGVTIVVTLQGEDLFLEGLPEPFKQKALDLIRRQVADVDLFIAVSRYYADFMTDYLAIPAAKMRVAPLGITMPDPPVVAPLGRNTDAPHVRRAERHHHGRGTESFAHRTSQRIACEIDVAPHTHALALPLPEVAAHRDAQARREQHGVTDLRMAVERQVRPVERHVVREQSGNAPVVRPDQGTRPAPEQPVVHQEEIDPLLGGQTDRGFTRIDGGAQAVDPSIVGDLQTIQCFGVVAHTADVEVGVEIVDELRHVHIGASITTLKRHLIDTSIHIGGGTTGWLARKPLPHSNIDNPHWPT
jgi:hypothetical protein